MAMKTINKCEQQIEQALMGNEFALIGAGRLGEMALSIWPKEMRKPLAIYDGHKTGTLLGYEIKNFNEVINFPRPIYLLSAFKIKPKEIVQIFKNVDQKLILTVYDFLNKYSPNTFSNGWRCTNPSANKKKKIQLVENLFDDERSKQAYNASVSWRYYRKLSIDYECDHEKFKYDQRNYEVPVKNYDLVIDAGSYDLHLAKTLSSIGCAVRKYLAFEPDPANYELSLRESNAILGIGKEKFTIEKLALFESDVEINFYANESLSSRIINKNAKLNNRHSLSLQAITLDEYLKKNPISPTKDSCLLKLHVEGAELSVLIGAENFIKKNAPDIFVSLSHDENSLLNIPLFLAGLGYTYQSMRDYAIFGADLTLFARHCTKM